VSAPAGPSMSIRAMVARQTRIERQESPHCASVSFERHAANAFQSYVHSALAFSIKVRLLRIGAAATAAQMPRWRAWQRAPFVHGVLDACHFAHNMAGDGGVPDVGRGTLALDSQPSRDHVASRSGAASCTARWTRRRT